MPQKRMIWASDGNPVAVRRWLAVDYSTLRADGVSVAAEIHWGDAMGFGSEYYASRTHGRRGHAPVVPATGQRFPANAISSLTNRCSFVFMVFLEGFAAAVFLRSLRHPFRLVSRVIFVVVDSHPMHRSKRVTRWITKRADQARLVFLTSCSPDLNPDEFLGCGMKAHAVGRRCRVYQTDLIANVCSYSRVIRHHLVAVRRFFKAPSVQYAAA